MGPSLIYICVFLLRSGPYQTQQDCKYEKLINELLGLHGVDLVRDGCTTL